MADDPFLSVVVPIYNEFDSLEELHRQLDAALASVAGGIEFILVDDGSSDDSLVRMRAIAEKDPRVRVLTLDRNHGQSAALDAGFRAVRGEVTAILDSDLQNDPADLPRLLAHLDHADVVNGVRTQRCDSRWRRLGSRVGNACRNWVTGESVTDVGCSLRVIRTEYLQRIRLYRGMHRFLPTLLRMEGARVTEVPVRHRPRRFGRSNYGNFDRLAVGLVDLWAVRWMQSRNTRYRVEERSGRNELPARALASDPAGARVSSAAIRGTLPER